MITYIAIGHEIKNGKMIPFKCTKIVAYCKNQAMTRATWYLDLHHSLIKLKKA